MARRIVRWLTPSAAAAVLAESQSAASASCPLSGVHGAACLSIAGVASPRSGDDTSARLPLAVPPVSETTETVEKGGYAIRTFVKPASRRLRQRPSEASRP